MLFRQFFYCARICITYSNHLFVSYLQINSIGLNQKLTAVAEFRILKLSSCKMISVIEFYRPSTLKFQVE